MLDDAIDQLLCKTMDRAKMMMQDADKSALDGVVEPILAYISMKAGWLVYVVEMLASLIVVQTMLLVVILYRT